MRWLFWLLKILLNLVAGFLPRAHTQTSGLLLQFVFLAQFIVVKGVCFTLFSVQESALRATQVVAVQEAVDGDVDKTI